MMQTLTIKNNHMRLNKLIDNVAEITEINKIDVKAIIEALNSEMKFQLLDWNKIVIPWICTIYTDETKYKSRYSKKFKCQVKIDNPIRLKMKTSVPFIKEINFKKD